MSGLGVEAVGISAGAAGELPEPAMRTEGTGPEGRSFSEVLHAGESEAGAGPGAAIVRDAVESIGRGERMVERVMRQARRGHVFTQEELLAVQAGVYRYTQELELASKLVDKATGAVRQTLQSQQ